MSNAATPPREEARAWIVQCRDAFVAHAADSVVRLRASVLDGVPVAGIEAPDIALRAQFVARWDDAVQVLRAALAGFCDEQLRFAEVSRVGQPYDFTASSLKLVDDSELELAIALDETRARLREASEAELYKLDARLAWLLDVAEIDEEHHPLGPAAVVYGLRQLLDQLGPPPLETRLWLLRLIEGALCPALPAAYARINAFLVDRQVLPRIALSIRRRDERGSVAPRPTEPATGLDELRRRVGSTSVASVMASEAALRALDAVLQALTSLQRQGDEQGPPAALRSLLAQRGTAELAGMDPVTVEIVSRLFDAIFADPDLPEAVRALLGWLQIPTLKLVLADPSFVSDDAHPARRVLDSIGRIALCLPADGALQCPAFLAIKAVVTRIRDGFERDPGLFAGLLGELEPYAGGSGLPGAPSASLANELALRYDRRAAAAGAAARVIDPLLRPGLPAALAAFLDVQWRECLVRVHLHPSQDTPWQQWCDAARDLVWSIEPKAGTDQRKQLLALLPQLVRRLHAGLDVIGMSPVEREPFIDALVALQSAAMKPPSAVAASTGGGNAGEAARAAGAGAALVWAMTREQAYEVRCGHLAPGQTPPPEAAVQPGDRVDFECEGLPRLRSYLAWYQREPRVLVFAGIDDRCLLVLSPPALQRLIQLGDASLVAAQPLMQRAVKRALEGLGRSP